MGNYGVHAQVHKGLSLQGQCWNKENQITEKSTPENQLSQTWT